MITMTTASSPNSVIVETTQHGNGIIKFTFPEKLTTRSDFIEFPNYGIPADTPLDTNYDQPLAFALVAKFNRRVVGLIMHGNYCMAYFNPGKRPRREISRHRKQPDYPTATLGMIIRAVYLAYQETHGKIDFTYSGRRLVPEAMHEITSLEGQHQFFTP